MIRLIPRLVIGLTAVHFAVALIASSTFRDMACDGFWNSVPGKPQREYEMWFFLAGFGLLALGTLSGRIVRDTGRLPAQLGWYLLVIGVPLQILYPVSGAPGLIALGVLALIATWRDSAGGGPSGNLSAREGRDAERRADQEDREQSAGVAESDRPATAASEA